MAWDRQQRYETPPVTSRFILDSLATADGIVCAGSFEEAVHRLEAAGINRIDFSWRCVLEAECSALRGERDSTAFPCGLGTESSLWLNTPKPVSELQVATSRDNHNVEPGWFSYH